MTTNSDRDLVSFGPFTHGVNNRLEDHEIGQDRLRQAVNVRLRDSGLLERRSGFEAYRAAAVKTHSLYPVPDHGIVFVDGTHLVLRNPDAGTEAVLRSDMNANQPVAYVTLPGGDVYFSDGYVNGRISGGELLPWGIAPPAGVPVLSSITGALPAGRYQVALVFVDASGEESGAGLGAEIQVTTGKGIRIAGIPAPTTEGVTGVVVYVSPANGEILYRAITLPLGVTQFDYITASATGRALKTRHITPPPAGRVLAYSAGRIYIGDGPIVWYTEPLQYGRCRKSSNFLLFPGDVSILAGVRDGLYAAADKTYWMSGTDPQAFSQTVVLEFGAAPRSLTALPEPDTWMWYSDRGMVQAGAGGAIREIQSGELFLDAAKAGASIYMEEEGIKQIVSVTQPEQMNDVAVSGSFIEMEVRRSGKRRLPLEAAMVATSTFEMEVIHPL